MPLGHKTYQLAQFCHCFQYEMGKIFQCKHFSQIQCVQYIKPLTSKEKKSTHRSSLKVAQFHGKTTDLATQSGAISDFMISKSDENVTADTFYYGSSFITFIFFYLADTFTQRNLQKRNILQQVCRHWFFHLLRQFGNKSYNTWSSLKRTKRTLYTKPNR